MDAGIFSKARAELASLLDKVNDDAAPVEIVRRDKPFAVLMSKEEHEGRMETLYLLSSPANAARLRDGMADIEAGRYSAIIIPGVNDN
jgi:antitoxin YefM